MNKSHLKVAYSNNPDGYGFMWNEGGRLNVVRGIAKDFNEIYHISKQLVGFQYTLHLRWRTKGTIHINNCHPFEILNQDNDGLDLSMMHNGTLFKIPEDPKRSDTQIFAEQLRSIILDQDPTFKLKLIAAIQSAVEKHNKMVFMTSDNRTFFVNKHLGNVVDDIWYSNLYSLEKDYRKKSVLETISKKKSNKKAISELSTEIDKKRWVHKRKAMPKWEKKSTSAKNTDLK